MISESFSTAIAGLGHFRGQKRKRRVVRVPLDRPRLRLSPGATRRGPQAAGPPPGHPRSNNHPGTLGQTSPSPSGTPTSPVAAPTPPRTPLRTPSGGGDRALRGIGVSNGRRVRERERGVRTAPPVPVPPEDDLPPRGRLGGSEPDRRRLLTGRYDAGSVSATLRAGGATCGVFDVPMTAMRDFSVVRSFSHSRRERPFPAVGERVKMLRSQPA